MTPSITRLATELVNARREEGRGATVILGAGASVSSGLKPWPELSADVCKDLALDVPPDQTPVKALQEHFQERSSLRDRYLALATHIKAGNPSQGYFHLAELIADGFVSTVVTTNWDSLLEDVLYSVVPAHDVKVLVRGEAPDDVIARIISASTHQALIIKIHGDLCSRFVLLAPSETRRLSHGLAESLTQRLKGHCIVVGHSIQDVDTLGLLLALDEETSLFAVRHASHVPSDVDRVLEERGSQIISGIRPSIVAAKQSVDTGDFDDFFTQLHLAVQLRVAKQERNRLFGVEKAILEKERRGSGYITNARITELIDGFSRQVFHWRPDLILFMNDPAAPGGLELLRRMSAQLLARRIPFGEILITGDKGSRTLNRAIRSDPLAVKPEPRKVLVLDDMAFSGRTFDLAKAQVQEWYPRAQIRARRARDVGEAASTRGRQRRSAP